MKNVGREPGQVVIGGDSCSEGREFESQHRILDGHFFIYFHLFKQTFHILQQINVKNVHPVYGTGI